VENNDMTDIDQTDTMTVDVSFTVEPKPLMVVPEQLPVIPEGPGALLSAIGQLARDPTVNIANLQALMTMQERLEDRQAERAYAEALRSAQAEVPQVERLGHVDLGKGTGYTFARLEDLDHVMRPIMEKHGFSIIYDRVMREGGGLIVTATLAHTGGHSKTASFPLPLDTGPGRNNLQAAGSTDSYARRYLLEGFFNIVRKGADDDGKSGGAKYILAEQVAELQGLLKEAGRDERTFLERLFVGSNIRSLTEIEVPQFILVKNTLDGLIHNAKAKRGTQA